MADVTQSLVVFGTSTFANLAAYCLKHDAKRCVVAFTVDPDYLRGDTNDGLPVIVFDSLPDHFSPDNHEILVPMGFTRINEVRRNRCEKAKAMGYHLANYVSNSASVWPELCGGDNTMIFDQAIVQPFVHIGEDVIVRSGANLGHHSRIGSHTFIASGVVTGGNVIIGEQCFIGLGAVLRDGVTIGERCFIGAGAVVVSDTQADGVYVGNPARRLPDKTSLDITKTGCM